MWTLIEELQKSVTWKNAARANTLAAYVDLYTMLVQLSPTGLLPAKKLQIAIMNCHKTKPVNFTGKTIDVFADQVGGLIRAGLSKFRGILLDDEAHRRCFAKACTTPRSNAYFSVLLS